MTDLGLFGFNGSDSTTSYAYCVNSSGTVIGTVFDSIPNPSQTYAYVYKSGISTQIQTALGNVVTVKPLMLNDNGDYVGLVETASSGVGFSHPIYWKQGVERDLLNDVGFQGSAVCVNKNGKVVVNVLTGGGGYYCYLWQDGKAVVGIGTNQFKGGWINDSDVIVGGSIDSTLTAQAQQWSGGAITDLGAGYNSFASCINNGGAITGYFQGKAGGQHAFLYKSGTVEDINDLVSIPDWTLNVGVSINDAGQVLCYGTNSTFTQTHSFLLTPKSPQAHK